MYLLDTDTIVYYLRGQQSIAERLLATEPDSLAVASVTLYELMVGVLKSTYSEQRVRLLEEFLSRVVVVPVDAAATRQAAQVRATLALKGASSNRVREPDPAIHKPSRPQLGSTS
jgi:tRNA(fMet)-specific endonuclease VapC